MIKDIKRIDLNGNEYFQESIVCDRCKNILSPKDFYYNIKLAGWRPVKIETRHVYGLTSPQEWHLCEKCFEESQKFMNGEETKNRKRKTSNTEQLPGQLDVFDIIDNKTE
jgi:hypothetical protein